MADETPDGNGAATTTEEPPITAETDLGEAGQKALREERTKAKDLGRQLREAQRELEKFRTASMSEQEKAVAAAKAEGATEASRTSAPRLVKAELRAAAAEAGLSKDALAGFLDYADLSKFVTDDGEPDDKAIAAAVKRLGGGSATDFDGGARTPAGKPADMNSLIRRQAGLG
jgi:hypothetical protein